MSSPAIRSCHFYFAEIAPTVNVSGFVSTPGMYKFSRRSLLKIFEYIPMVLALSASLSSAIRIAHWFSMSSR